MSILNRAEMPLSFQIHHPNSDESTEFPILPSLFSSPFSVSAFLSAFSDTKFSKPGRNALQFNQQKQKHATKPVNNGKEKGERKKPFDNTVKLLLAGAISTIVSRTLIAPLERLKLEYAVRGAKDNWFKTSHLIWSSEGLTGFWRGNALNLFRIVPFKTINFVIYEMYCSWISKRGEITYQDRLVAGALSGILATTLCLPMDTIRTRLIAPGGESLGGIGGCFNHMVQREGFFSIYKGLSPILLSIVPESAIFYGLYDILKESYIKSAKHQESLKRQITHRERTETLDVSSDTKKKSNGDSNLVLGPIRTLLYGAIAGACAETVTYPLEIVRRHIQLQQTTELNLLATFGSIIEKEGANALFAGLIPSTMQVLPSAALTYFVYEFMKVKLKISQ